MRSIFWLMPAVLVESIAVHERVAVEPTITQAPRLWELDLRRRQNEEIDPYVFENSRIYLSMVLRLTS